MAIHDMARYYLNVSHLSLSLSVEPLSERLVVAINAMIPHKAMGYLKSRLKKISDSFHGSDPEKS